MIQLGPFSTGFSNTVITIPPGLTVDEDLHYMIRCRNPSALSTVAAAFSWFDENGVLNLEVATLVALSSVSQLCRGSTPIRRAGSSPIMLSAVLVGLGQFDVLWSTNGI